MSLKLALPRLAPLRHHYTWAKQTLIYQERILQNELWSAQHHSVFIISSLHMAFE